MFDVIFEVRRQLDDDLVCFWSGPGDLAGAATGPFTDEISLPDTERLLLSPVQDVSHGEWLRPGPTDIAVIAYTSGTTGPSKGSMSTHANLAIQALGFKDWFGCSAETSVLTIAPLFHITGLGGHLALALVGGYPMVMTGLDPV